MKKNSFSLFGAWRVFSLALLITLAVAPALAQWQWIDDTGNRVFSDTPPPAGTPEKHILKRPGGERVRASSSTGRVEPTGAAASAAPALKPVSAGTDKELQARKKQAEQAEETRRNAEQERLMAARADSCERAKRTKTTLNSGVRLVTTNTQGEREVMDDKTRAAEVKRLDDIIRLNCGPLPDRAAAQ